MKKRYSLLIAVLLTALTLSGCVKLDADITVKKNGKADISLVYAVDESVASLAEAMNYFLNEEQLQQLQDNGWELKPYSGGGFAGYELAVTDLDLKSEGSGQDTGDIDISAARNGTIVTVDARLLSEEQISELNRYASLLNDMGSSFRIRLTLPVQPVKHNAATVTNDGKTLEWDILSMNLEDPLHVEVNVLDVFRPYLIGGGAGVLALLILLILIVRGRARKKKALKETA